VRDPEVLRYFLMSSHYRGPINYSLVQIEQADASLVRLYTALRDLEPSSPPERGSATEAFTQAMDDDFNTPEALAVLQQLATEVNRAKASGETERARKLASELVYLGGVLGILQQRAEEFLRKPKHAAPRAEGESAAAHEYSDERVEALIAERAEARKAKNFKRSDEIRDELARAGIVLEDMPGGKTTWRRA
jgi:cysteinyl-tRNA synthetase